MPIKNPENCIRYSTETKTCLQCSAYTQETNLTEDSSRVCAYIKEHCLLYNSYGSCIECERETAEDGYVLRGRTCLIKATNCLVRNPSKLYECQKDRCTQGYHWD